MGLLTRVDQWTHKRARYSASSTRFVFSVNKVALYWRKGRRKGRLDSSSEATLFCFASNKKCCRWVFFQCLSGVSVDVSPSRRHNNRLNVTLNKFVCLRCFVSWRARPERGWKYTADAPGGFIKGPSRLDVIYENPHDDCNNYALLLLLDMTKITVDCIREIHLWMINISSSSLEKPCLSLAIHLMMWILGVSFLDSLSPSFKTHSLWVFAYPPWREWLGPVK